jgi:hypothetical protein
MNALRRASRLVAALFALVAAPAAASCRFPVTSYVKPPGALPNDLTAVARFADMRLTPDAVGYGATGERLDEITVAEGELHLTRPNRDGVSTRNLAEAGEGPLFMHLAPVQAWSRAQALGAAESLDELAERLDAAVGKAGCAEGATLAFRIVGQAATVTWSLDTRPERREVTTANQPVVIVGIYTTDPGAYAMPTGRRFHSHVVVPSAGGAGHVRAVQLQPAATLQLQAR